jgi:23S rRNA pseudouridine2605 synthase
VGSADTALAELRRRTPAVGFFTPSRPGCVTIRGMERLNKFLAHAGVGSRRHCDSLITAGRVAVDGRRVTDLGIKIDPATQKVSVDDHPVWAERAVYWAVNKPPGYLSTNHDPAGRPLARDLVPHVEQRVYTVGRLDEASEGLLLMTNDGDLADALMHPRYGVEKTYQVLVAGKPSREDLQKLLDGVWLSEGRVRARKVRRLKPQGDSTWIRVVLTEGKNREIRRMLARLGHKVMRLKRVAIGPVQLDRLPKGKARKLSAAELTALKAAVAEAKTRVERALERARRKAGGRHPPERIS